MTIQEQLYNILLAESNMLAIDFISDSANFADPAKWASLKTFINTNANECLTSVLVNFFFGNGSNLDYESSIAKSLGIELSPQGVINLMLCHSRYLSAINTDELGIDNAFASESITITSGLGERAAA